MAGFIARHAMWARGAKIGVAVSGGADSVCLLHLLRELFPALDLTVIHVNHFLRGHESLSDEAFVRELAGSLGLAVIVEHAPVASGHGIEEAARDARRAVFLREIRSGRADLVALAHTRSDQAETVLFRFLRGAYTTGLAGIRPVTPEGLVRPLLETSRDDVLAYLRSRGLAWREDHTNLDPRFSRNRIRHQLLPELVRDWNPNLPELLAHHAGLAQDDEEYWAGEVDRRMPAAVDDAVVLNCDDLSGLPPALSRRIIRRALGVVKGDLRQIDFSHIETILEMIRRPSGHYRVQVPGVDALRSFCWVRFSGIPRGPRERDFQIPIPAMPSEIRVPGSHLILGFELTENSEETRDTIDWSRVDGPLILRNWRPGDAYRGTADQRKHKLKTLFHEARVPLWERRYWPVVITGAGRIVWTRRFGPASEVAAHPQTRVVLRITEKLRLCESGQAVFTSL